jgi:hypothetical protein
MTHRLSTAVGKSVADASRLHAVPLRCWSWHRRTNSGYLPRVGRCPFAARPRTTDRPTDRRFPVPSAAADRRSSLVRTATSSRVSHGPAPAPRLRGFAVDLTDGIRYPFIVGSADRQTARASQSMSRERCPPPPHRGEWFAASRMRWEGGGWMRKPA